MTAFFGYSGVCDVCGRFDYVSVGGKSQRCDPCETRHRIRQDFARNPTLAAQAYCSATADDALRLLGVEADPKDDR